MATPTGLTPAPSTALANSWLTGRGYYTDPPTFNVSDSRFYKFESPPPTWKQLTSFEALTPEQQSKIERILAYTFDIAVTQVKRFFSNLSCIQWSDTPNFINGLPKYILLQKNCVKVWRDFFDQMPANPTEGGKFHRRVSLLFCETSEDTITALGTVGAIKKIFMTYRIFNDGKKTFNASLRKRMCEENNLSIAFLSSTYCPEEINDTECKENAKKKVFGNLSILVQTVSFFETTKTIRGSSSMLVMGTSTWSTPSCNYSVSGSNVYTTPTVMYNSSSYYYRTGVDSPSTTSIKWESKFELSMESLEDDENGSILVVPPETRELVQYPTHYFEDIGYSQVVMTHVGPRRISQRPLLPDLFIERNSGYPFQRERAIAAISKITGLSEEIISQENLKLELLEFATSGHILHGFPIEAEMTYDFMEQCLIPLLAKHLIFTLNLISCPPRPNALIPFFNQFSQHYVEDLYLPCPMTKQEEFAFTQQNVEVKKRVAMGKEYTQYISYYLNPYMYHHSFKPVCEKYISESISLKSPDPLQLMVINVASLLPSLKATKFTCLQAQCNPKSPLVLGKNQIITGAGIRRGIPINLPPPYVLRGNSSSSPYAKSVKALVAPPLLSPFLSTAPASGVSDKQ